MSYLSYLYVKRNRFLVRSTTVTSLEHALSSRGAPEAEACGAVGGALGHSRGMARGGKNCQHEISRTEGTSTQRVLRLGGLLAVAIQPRECLSVRYGQRANQLNELLQKLIGVHEHGKVPTTVDRHKLFARCFDGVEVSSSKRSRSRKVFSSLNEEHRNRKFKAEILRPAGLRLGDESFAAQHLAINGIIDVLHRIAWSNEREANCSQ
jgi:hypothetical protein